MNKKVKKILVSTSRLVVGFGVAAFLLNKVFDKQTFVEQVENGNCGILAVVPLLFATVLLLTFIRWQRLLRVLDINLPFWDVFRLGMIGSFFNGSLPGAVSGDVVKVIYIRRHAPGRKTEAVLTMLLDRVFGLFGLLTVAVVSCMISLQFILQADERIQLAAGFVGICSLCGILGCLCVFFRKRLVRLPGVEPMIAFGKRKLPEAVIDVFQRVVDALDLYRNSPRTVATALGLSILVHMLNAAILVTAARAIHEYTVPASRYFLTAQVSNALGSIPLSPGGIGLRDYVTEQFLQDAGDKAGVIPIIVTLNMYFWYMIGGIFFVIGKVGGDPDLVESDHDECTEETA